MKYVLGIDSGIGSVAWALLLMDDKGNIIRIVDSGECLFSNLEDKDGKTENIARRVQRIVRRQKRRKRTRLDDALLLFKKYLNVDLQGVDRKHLKSPYELKVKGLTQKLTKEELCVALFHYMKFRGFKSSRKVEDVKNKDNKILLNKIEEVSSKLSDNKTITQYLLEEYSKKSKENKRIHNSSSEYLLTVSRSMYLKEMEKLFAKQVELGTCSKDFEEKFLERYQMQRDSSVGPGGDSIYGAKGGSFIEKMIGKCSFDGELRAPKNSYSAEAFTLLSFLTTIRYKENYGDSGYIGLTAEEIQKVFEMVKTKKEISYADIFKTLNKKAIYRVKGLDLPKKKYLSLLNKYKESKNISENLTGEELEEFNKYSKEELFKAKLKVGMPSFYSLKKAFDNKAHETGDVSLLEFVNDSDVLDEIASILLVNKTDDAIIKACALKGYSQNMTEVILGLDGIKATINLSLNVCRKVIPFLFEGYTYDKAMEKAGFIHTENHKIVKTDRLPEIDEAMRGLDERLTNPNVRHTLVFVRQVINALLDKYGVISEYNIELSRELKKSFEQRKKMTFDMLDNQDENRYIKETIVKKYSRLFKSIYSVKKDDVLKYKLFIEQSGKSAYTNLPINESLLFDDNEYQIDHILPFSRTFDNSYLNLVVVETKMNQLKKNMTPKEAFEKTDYWKGVMEFISTTSISARKRDKILANEIDDDFIGRNSSDSSYIAKTAKKLIENYLQPERCTCPSGAVTDKLKYLWGLKGYTHSLLNEKYLRNGSYILKGFQIKEKAISFDFITEQTKQNYQIEINKVETKGKKILSDEENEINKCIDFFYQYPSFLATKLNLFIDKPIHLFVESVNPTANNINESGVNTYLFVLASKLDGAINKNRMIKDRSNDLHHVLDAIVIAATTPKMINRVTNYYLEKEKHMVINPETGEVQDDFDNFPLPYEGFKEEAILRVYERDGEKLLSKLNDLPQYKEKKLEKRDVSVLFPARFPEKNKNGAFHKETIFGSRNGAITKKMPVGKLTEKNINDIFDGNGGNKCVKEACLEWLKQGDKKPLFPIHPTTGNYIKSVLMVESNDVRSRVRISENENKFAANESCIRVDIYKKNGEERLFFVPVFRIQLEKEKKYFKDTAKGLKAKMPIYQIMWGQNDNCDYISGEKLKMEYTNILQLPRYSLIEVELFSGAKGFCYSGGLTKGFFEVYSVIGDGIDLIKSGLFNSVCAQYRFTVSTIKSIKLHNISILGKKS